MRSSSRSRQCPAPSFSIAPAIRIIIAVSLHLRGVVRRSSKLQSALAAKAAELIDLNHHRGVHPRARRARCSAVRSARRNNTRRVRRNRAPSRAKDLERTRDSGVLLRSSRDAPRAREPGGCTARRIRRLAGIGAHRRHEASRSRRPCASSYCRCGRLWARERFSSLTTSI